MPGQFDPAALPKRPGVYTRYVSDAEQVIPPSAGSILCVPFTHSWGPLEEPVLLGSYAQFLDTYGEDYTPGKIAVRGAFLGEAVDGSFGAGAVLAYRMGSAAAQEASVTLNNATVPAQRLEARYTGTRGNDLRVTVQDYAADTTKDELILYDGTVELERYVYANTALQDLADQINATSDWITADTPLAPGTTLVPVTAVAFSNGNDGSTLVAQDWTDAMTRLEVERFGLFAPYDLTDSAILASLKTWAVNLNNKGRRFLTVVGGGLADSVSLAITRSGTLNHPDFVNFGAMTFFDDDLIDPATNEPAILSTSQMAARIAGIFARKGDSASATYARMAAVRIRTGPTEAGIDQAFDGGVLVAARDDDPTAPVHLERALTTYVTTSDDAKPYLIFRNPKFVRTMHIFEREITEWAARNVVGKVPVNDKTRRGYLGEAQARLEARVDRGVIQEDPLARVSVNPPPSDDDEFIAIDYGMAFGRSAEQVLNTILFK